MEKLIEHLFQLHQHCQFQEDLKQCLMVEDVFLHYGHIKNKKIKL